MRVIGLSGDIGSGKDLVAKMLVLQHPVRIDGAWADARQWDDERDVLKNDPVNKFPILASSGVQIAFADKVKEICMDLYEIDPRLLWGPSALRSTSLLVWPIAHVFDRGLRTQCDCGMQSEDSRATLPCRFMTPRDALRRIGTQGGRGAHLDTWARTAMRRATQLSAEKRVEPVQNNNGNHGSHRAIPAAELVVISDVRFPNEADAIEAAGGEVWCIDDTGYRMHKFRETGELGLRKLAGPQHESDAYTKAIKERLTTRTIYNRGSLTDLYTDVRGALRGEWK